MKELNLILLLFLMVTGVTMTASAQSIIHQDSCICYTEIQDKRANECLMNRAKRDSNFNDLKEIALTQEETIVSLQQSLDLSEEIIILKDNKIKHQKKMIRRRELLIVTISAVGVIELILLLAK